ncbi:MAG: hypothetical protein PSV35_09185 [bacterium]|nr:hypothetical protein [bacterium]
MPLNNEKKLMVILDNLNDFADKLIGEIADESEHGYQQLVAKIQQAYFYYNKPIESPILGWVYYFTRTRGNEINLAIKNIEAYTDTPTRLKEFKSLVNDGQWNVGSFNYYLFIELINSVPGYEPLDKESLVPVMKRLRELLLQKSSVFIAQLTLSNKLIEEREQERQNIHPLKGNSVVAIELSSDLKSSQTSAQIYAEKIYFCLVVKKNEWQLSWIDYSGTVIALKLNKELTLLLEHLRVKHVEQLNPIQERKIKHECLKIREIFLAKTQLLINPDEKTHEALIAKGVTSTFILRGTPNHYNLDWINSLGKITTISLEKKLPLKTWLNNHNSLSEHDIPQLKAFLLQINTAQSIGMDEFKKKLKNCLAPEPVGKKLNSSKRINLDLFSDLNRCLGNHLRKSKDEINPPHLANKLMDKPIRISPKLNLERYSALTTLFGHKAQSMHQLEDIPEEQTLTDSVPQQDIIQNYWQ